MFGFSLMLWPDATWLYHLGAVSIWLAAGIVLLTPALKRALNVVATRLLKQNTDVRFTRTGLIVSLIYFMMSWIPFILETMDYELFENAPVQFAQLKRKPSEYFQDHWHATYWFERNRGNVQGLIDSVGEDNVLFSTDYPHPTSLYPKPLDCVADQMSSLRDTTRRKVLGENAAKLYRLERS